MIQFFYSNIHSIQQNPLLIRNHSFI